MYKLQKGNPIITKKKKKKKRKKKYFFAFYNFMKISF